jgi:hypothetical protein
MTRTEFAPHIGATFVRKGRTYTVTGFKTSRPKFPVSATRDDGRQYKFTVEGFLQALQAAAPVAVEGLTQEIRQGFARLVSRLSPENLACDGECSQAQVRARRRAIKNEWAALEARAGQRVMESDTWDWDPGYNF